jgi:pyruvate,water dikinase
MTLIVDFDQPQLASLALVGGKGSNLIQLAAAGFPVPPGFVVTAEAYRLFADTAAWLEGSLAALDFDDPAHLRDQCDQVRDRLRLRPLPAAVEAAIVAALRALQVSEDDALAVRSTSTLEDLAQAAFAGQHDTFLNVRGTRSVLDRVRACFVSLWGDRAVLYRHHQGFPQTGAHMAVVVQRLVACDRAGVGFSINPVTGQLDRLVIDANYGLGESVVSGEGEVDHFELTRETLQVAARAIGRKQRKVVPTEAGTAEHDVPPELAEVACLADEELRAVGALLEKVEAHYGWPQDIEWGWADHRLYLLQSRAVTTIQPRYTRDESAERFPNPMTPLTWDFISAVFRRSLTESLALMGLPPLRDDWFSLHDSYVYGNQNAVALLAAYRPLRARTPQELVEEIPRLRARYAWVSELPLRWASGLDRYLVRLGRLSARPIDTMTVPELGQHIDELMEVSADYFAPNIAISITQSFLHRLLLALVGMVVGKERALLVFDGLMAGCETKTAVVNRELYELARLATHHEPLRRALVEQTGRAAWDAKVVDAYPEFARRLRRFLEDHGHREVDMDYYQPTWSGQPWVVLDAIALIVRGGCSDGDDPEASARAQRQRYAATELAFLPELPEGLRFFFRELIRLARTYTTLDDLEHYQTTRVNAIARDVALALGRRLVEAKVLDSADDVFFLRRDDLARLAGEFPPPDPSPYRDRARKGREAYDLAWTKTPPWSLSEPALAAPESAPGDGAAGQPLRGLPGGPGRVTAPCFLVRGPDDFGRFPAGSVLVARTTNPAWTPLFYSAVGLITESGGPLSHGAVTAREMRLPAVMSVREALSRLRDGQVVTVDGTLGTVTLTEA